jgi:hypothetical protein
MLDIRWWRVVFAFASIYWVAWFAAGMNCRDCTADERCLFCPIVEILSFPAIALEPAIEFIDAYPALGPPAFLSVILINSVLWGAVLAEPVRWWFGWPPWRFSLRTLLIATTLVAVVLGLGVWVAR